MLVGERTDELARALPLQPPPLALLVVHWIGPGLRCDRDDRDDRCLKHLSSVHAYSSHSMLARMLVVLLPLGFVTRIATMELRNTHSSSASWNTFS